MDIRAIDLKFRGLDHAISSYLVVGPQGPVLIETGPSTTLPALREGLAEHGYEPEDIQHVLLTHIHLDHAGAAGWFAQRNAHVYVHHLGAPHLVDPSKLLQSATRIYGDEMDTLWGDVPPVPANRITPLYDGDEVKVGGLKFKAIETPGHARHHHAFRLEDTVFTGDAAGIHVPGSSLISLPTPPPEFDLETWHRTIERLRGEKFEVMFPTHCCPIEDVPDHLEGLHDLLEDSATFVRSLITRGADRARLIEEYAAWNHQRAVQHRVPADLLPKFDSVNPLFMSVDGLARYWRKRMTG